MVLFSIYLSIARTRHNIGDVLNHFWNIGAAHISSRYFTSHTKIY